MPFGVDLGDIEDAIKEYGPGAALGGGIGFLTGGPPGAVVGAAGAVAGQVAAKEAVKALPEDSPDWLKTGVEFGVYGVTGAVGEGALAQRGLSAALKAVLEDSTASAAKKTLAQEAVDAGSHLNPLQIARSGLESGVGAVGGKFVAEQLGVPPILGEIAGSIAGPVAVTHFTAAKAANAQKVLAESSADPNAISRQPNASKVILGSAQADIDSLRQQAQFARARSGATSMSDDYVRDLTGGWTRQDAVRMARGQLPQRVKDVTSTELINAQRRLPRIQSQWDNAKQALADAEGALGVDPNTGTLTNQKDHYLFKGQDGTEKLIPDEQAKAYLDAQKKFQTADSGLKSFLGTDQLPGTSEEALLALREKHIPNWKELVGNTPAPSPDLTATHTFGDTHLNMYQTEVPNTYEVSIGRKVNGEAQNASGKSQGSDLAALGQVRDTVVNAQRANPDATFIAFPTDARRTSAFQARGLFRPLTEEEKAALRGNYGDAVDKALILDKTALPPASGTSTLPSPETAQQWLRDIKTGDIELSTKNLAKNAANEAQAKQFEDFANFLEQNLGKFGVLGEGMKSQAARDFAAWQQQDQMLKQYPGGHLRAKGGSEDFGNYVKYAHLVSDAEDTSAGKVAKFNEIISNPRGSIMIEDPNGALQARKIVLDTDKRPVMRPPEGADPVAAAKRLQTGDTSGWTIQVRGTGVASPIETVPLDSLKLHYTDAQIAARARESGEAGRRLWANLPEDQLDNFAARVNGIKRPEPAYDEVHYATQAQRDNAVAAGKPDGPVVENDLKTAYQDFMSRFTPSETSVEGKMFTPEYQARMENVIKTKYGMTPRTGSTAAERAAFYDSRAFATMSINDRLLENGIAVDDQAKLAKMLEVERGERLPDMMSATDTLLALSHDPLVELDKATPMKGFLGALADRIQGLSIVSPMFRGMMQSHFNAAEASAVTVGATYGPTIRAAEVRASKLMNEATGMATVGNAFSTLARTRSLKAAFEEIHPISRDYAIGALMAREFKPEGLPADWQKIRSGLTPEQLEQADKWVTSNWMNFVDNPRAFPGIANDPDMDLLARFTRHQNETAAHTQNLLASKPQDTAQKMLSLVTRDFRKYVDTTQFEGKEPNPYALAKSVFNIAKVTNDKRPFNELVAHGKEAALASVMTMYNTAAIRELFGQIKEVAPGIDLTYGGGAWSIKNLENAPKEHWADINAVNSILKGEDRWSGLQKWSQQIAMGNLAADLSILGIQGWKVAAHTLLSGDPIGAVKTISAGLTHIMSDHGFYSWQAQNQEELTYLASMGLTGGIKQFIAGPEIQKLPLENLPGIGRAFTGIREGTDLQFNRSLYYWKVEGVRQQLEFAKTMQNIPREMAERFLNSSPSAKAVMDDLGGLDSYIYGAKEDTVKAVVRQINRGLGGINMNAEGVGPTRQAIEQITMVVPGFFRAQAGQWAAAVTKPNTLEGQLAISMLAREYMFAGSVATGMARLMGTEHKINWSDPSKSTWLGVPLPDGATVTLTPTMAIPRLASRVVKEAISAPQEGRVPNPGVALDQFVRGRMSPLVSPILEAFEGHDFYGNTYTSKLDKWGSTLSHVTMPILADTMVNDIKEQIRQNNATGSMDVKSIAEDTVAQLLGKGAIPARPGAKLNDLANQAYGTDWNLLTDAEKGTMRASNPAVRGIEAEYDFVSNRQATSAQSHVDMAYKDYQLNHDQVWTQPIPINGKTTTQQQDDQLLKSGDMTGDEWRNRYHVRQQASAQWYDALRQRLGAEGYDPDQIRQDHMDKLKESRDPNDQAWLVQDARVRYLGQKPDTVPQEITTPNGPVTIQVTDWQAFRAKQDAVLAQYPESVRGPAKESALADSDPGIAAYKSASEQQQAIESLPRYKGLSVEQGNKIDTVLSVMSKMADSIKGQMGLPPGTAVPGLTQAIRAKAIQSLQTAGVLKTSEDMQLATMAVAMAEDRKLTDSLRNPAQVLAVLQSPQAVVYYPYLRYRVPKQLWNRLPAQIFQAPLAAAELQAQEGQ